MIEYIKDRKRLGYIKHGDKAYYMGRYLKCTVIKKPNEMSAACPCETKRCVFQEERKNAVSTMCPVARYCMSIFRKDQETVVFSEYEPTRVEMENFTQMCREKGLNIQQKE